jgi:hypothetical protein
MHTAVQPLRLVFSPDYIYNDQNIFDNCRQLATNLSVPYGRTDERTDGRPNEVTVSNRKRCNGIRRLKAAEKATNPAGT